MNVASTWELVNGLSDSDLKSECKACWVKSWQGWPLSVLDAYRADKFSLVSRACASMDGSYLENLSGLTAFRAKAAEKLADLDDLDWDDDDSEGEM